MTIQEKSSRSRCTNQSGNTEKIAAGHACSFSLLPSRSVPPAWREAMRCLVFALALLGAAATAAPAQDAIPDLKGTWTGKGKSIVFGNHPHHPGAQTAN